jgi:hypothetical protein
VGETALFRVAQQPLATAPGEATVIEARLPLTDPERWEP